MSELENAALLFGKCGREMSVWRTIALNVSTVGPNLVGCLANLVVLRRMPLNIGLSEAEYVWFECGKTGEDREFICLGLELAVDILEDIAEVLSAVNGVTERINVRWSRADGRTEWSWRRVVSGCSCRVCCGRESEGRYSNSSGGCRSECCRVNGCGQGGWRQGR